MQNSSEKLVLYKERDLGQMMGLAANLIRRHYKHMFRTIGIMTLPLVLMASTLYYLGTASIIKNFDLALGKVPQNNYNLNILLSYIAIYLAYCAILWACVYYVKLYDEKGPENFTWNDIWAKVFKHGWKLLFSNIAIFLIIGIPMGLSFLLLFTVILAPATFIIIVGLASFTQLWTILYLYEEASLFDALDSSIKLMKKQWWKAIELLICSYLIVFGLMSLPAAIGLLIGFASGGIGLEAGLNEDTLFFVLLIQNLSMVLSFLSSFFLALSFTAFYLSNKERFNKISLQNRVAMLAENKISSTYS